MKRIVFLFLFLFFPMSLFGFIPPGMMILQRMAGNNGSGIYQIDYEIQFSGPNETINLKETWLIENENLMKVVVSTEKENVLFVFQYKDSQRKDDFFEKFFHFREPKNIASDLIKMKIATPDLIEKKKISNIKEYTYKSEEFLRLSRAGGVVTFAFGKPALAESEDIPPGLWVEQDQFLLRKLRLPSQAEITAEKHMSFSKGLIFPKIRVVRWDNKQVQLNTLSIVSRTKENFVRFGSKISVNREALLTHPSWPIIEEFYKRFR